MRSGAQLLSILVLVCLKSLALAQEPPRLELVLQTGHTHEITGVALSADGKYVVTGSKDRTAILWETASGRKVQSFSGHTQMVTGVAVSGNGKQVVTAAADKTAILWDAASGKKIQSFAWDAASPKKIA